MAALDFFIALFVLLAVLRGARTGFLAGVFSLVGVVVGASVGSRIASSLVPDGDNPVYGVGVTLISVVAFAVLGRSWPASSGAPCATGSRTRPRGPWTT
jgi:uncharacterized membrane protein required for colicin V production